MDYTDLTRSTTKEFALLKPQKWTLLFSLGLLIVGSAGYLLLHRDFWIFYVFAHLGALGVIGLLASSAGTLARKKRRGYWRAFSLVTVLSIFSGIVAVLIFSLGEEAQLYCGGSVSLAIAILMIISYWLAKKKTSPHPN